MKRKEFINTLTGSLAGVCVACLTVACSSKEMAGPAPAPSPGGSGSIPTAFSVKLDTELKAINDFVAKSGVIVIRTASGNTPASFLAFSSVCPHAGATVEYNNGTNSFFCAAHGSSFSGNGSLLAGPATRGLTSLVVEIAGNSLTTKA
jgi:cytochrome b6-f complex iron-sulfur subunit